MKQSAAVWAVSVCLAVSQVTAQYGPPPSSGKKHRTTTTTTETPGAISNEIPGPFPVSDSGSFSYAGSSATATSGQPGSGVVTGGSYWWAGPESPFKPGAQPAPTGPARPPPPPPPPACGGPAGCTGVGTDPRPSPVNPTGKPIDIAQNPFLSSAILGKPIPQSPQGCQGYGGSCQYPSGQGPTQYPGTPVGTGSFPSQSTQYPASPSKPVGGQYPAQSPYPSPSPPSSQYPGSGAPVGPGQYPGQPEPSGPIQYPDQSKPTGSNQYPGQPQPTGSNQYPSQPQPTGPGQYPGQPQTTGPVQYPAQPQPTGSSQYPGQPQPIGSSQYPGQPQPTGSSQYPGQPQPIGSSQYPSQPQPTGSSQYPGQPKPAGSNQYPGQPQPTGPIHYPGQPQPTGPIQYPGQPQPTGPSQYPSQPQPTGSSQYPGQPKPIGSNQYPGQPQPTVSNQYPGQPQPTGSSQYPGQPQYAGQPQSAPNVPLRPQCSLAGHACVPSSMCVNGEVTLNGMRQLRDPQVKECIPGLEACCKMPSPGSSPGTPRPDYGAGTQRPYTGPLNTTPYPGCAAALKCVAENYCTAEGVMSDSPVILTREQADNKVPLTDCQDLETGIIGKCCRDPNYEDPWPGGMMMMKNPGGFDDGQYHGEGSGPASNPGPSYNTISSTPLSPAKDHGPKPSNLPGGFNKPFPPPFPGANPSSAAYTPSQPSSPSPSGFSYPNNQPGPPQSPYQPTGTPYTPGQPSYQPGQPSGTPNNLEPSPSESYQPVQPTGTPFQPGQPSGSPYQPIKPNPKDPLPSQPSQPPVSPYQPAQPSGSTYQPNQPSSSPFQPPINSYQPSQPIPAESTNQPSQPGPEGTPQPDFPGQETEYNLPTHPGQKPLGGSGPTDQVPPSDSPCGLRRPGPGGDTAGFGEISWQALVVSAGNRSLLCGAAIISDNAVVTAAHCVNQLKAQDLLVKAGEWALLGQNPKPVQVRPVAAIARHPAYDSGSLAKDLAILVVAEPFTFDIHVNKICIPQDVGSEYFQKPGQTCLISGWGKNALQGPLQNSELHIVDVTVVPAKQCEAKLKTSQNLGKYFILNEGFSCALPPNPTDLCKVDFGSAVACERGDGLYELAGVNSWDIACQTKQPLPSVFATSDAQWINIVLGTPLPVLQSQEDSFNQGLLQGEGLQGVDTDDKPGFSQGYGK